MPAGAAEPEALAVLVFAAEPEAEPEPKALAGAGEPEALLTRVDSGLTPGTVPPK